MGTLMQHPLIWWVTVICAGTALGLLAGAVLGWRRAGRAPHRSQPLG